MTPTPKTRVEITKPWRVSGSDSHEFGSSPSQWAAAVRIDGGAAMLVTRTRVSTFDEPAHAVYLLPDGPVDDAALIDELREAFGSAFPLDADVR